VAGRSPGWSAGYIDSRLGRARQPSTRAAGSAPRMRCLPSSRYRCGLGLALCQRASDESASRGHQQSYQVTQGSHAVLLLDRAGWHQTGGKLRVPRNISLLHVPPYSPELNPAENIWQFLRQNHLSNRVKRRGVHHCAAGLELMDMNVYQVRCLTSLAGKQAGLGGHADGGHGCTSPFKSHALAILGSLRDCRLERRRAHRRRAQSQKRPRTCCGPKSAGVGATTPGRPARVAA
jgi:hypothetical protein